MSERYINPKTSFDEYPQDDIMLYHDKPVSDFQKNFILSTFPRAEIISAEYVNDEWLPCPVKIHIKDCGRKKTVYLKIGRHIGGVRAEAYVIPLLSKFGLNVPEILAGPVVDTNSPNLGDMTIISELEGENIMDFYFKDPSDSALAIVKKLVLEGVDTYHSLTPKLIGVGADKILPYVTLDQELKAIIMRGGDWFQHRLFADTLNTLKKVLKTIHDPLVFTNGDIHPGNFLCKDGKLSGFIDFSHSSFKDALYGFAKYFTYDIYPFKDIIYDYLRKVDKSYDDFIPRLKLRTLWTLQREVSLTDDIDTSFRNYLLDFLLM